MADANLKELFALVLECFPEDKQKCFRDPDDRHVAFDLLAAASPSGHARRWFAVTDGQDADEVFFDGYRLLSLEESVGLSEDLELLRADSKDFLVHREWVAIAESAAGDLLMIEDRDGRVLEVLLDESSMSGLDVGAVEWLLSLAEDFDSGALIWDAERGLTAPEEVEREEAELREATRVARRRRMADRREETEAPPFTGWQLLHFGFWLLMTWYFLREIGCSG